MFNKEKEQHIPSTTGYELSTALLTIFIILQGVVPSSLAHHQLRSRRRRFRRRRLRRYQHRVADLVTCAIIADKVFDILIAAEPPTTSSLELWEAGVFR
jgi:hypothetical protein